MSSEVFSYLRCADCACIFIEAIPGDLGSHYGAGYSPYTWRDPGVFDRIVEAERPKLDVVRQFARHGALLEIGPAAGTFAVLASRNGFEVTAVEMDAQSCAFMESQGIRTILSDDVAGAIASLERFDVIALWHVIEHLANPAHVLNTLAKKLRSGGALVVATPNPESAEFSLFRRCWVHLDAPRHLTLIPRSALDRLAAAEGLSPARLGRRLESDAAFDGAGWFMRSVRNVLASSPRPPILGRFAEFVAPPLYAPFALLHRWQGNAYTPVYTRHG